MKQVKTCILCGNSAFITHLVLKDYFLSGESFEILECQNCHFRFTNLDISPEEISKYYASERYVSHCPEAKGLFNKIYIAVRKFTVRRKLKITEEFKEGHYILDVGCGTGEFLTLLNKRGWKTVGIETNSNAREYCITHYGLEMETDLLMYKAAPESFDVITLWHVLEHLPDLHEQLNKIKSLLKSDGILIIAIPNCDSYDAQYYQKFWAAYDVPRHLYHFTRPTLSCLLQLHGYHIIDIFSMKLDAYYVSMLSEKYKTGKSHYFHGFVRGIISNLMAWLKGKEYSSMIYVIKKNIQ